MSLIFDPPGDKISTVSVEDGEMGEVDGKGKVSGRIVKGWGKGLIYLRDFIPALNKAFVIFLKAISILVAYGKEIFLGPTKCPIILQTQHNWMVNVGGLIGHALPAPTPAFRAEHLCGLQHHFAEPDITQGLGG